jgi:hypothetical protein
MNRWVVWTCAGILSVAARAEEGRVTFDLRQQWDPEIPLANPDKGWYHHFYDNAIDKYLARSDDELTAFPGMDHVYLRLAWSYLEPEEGRFNWRVVDDPIERWTKLGLGIAFRISCKETGTDRTEQQFATPRWVRDAGAEGGHFSMGRAAGPDAPWEPMFDDPVFLQKLDAFLAAFAARYDGRPWLRYVDIGSLGDWGEGHTWAGSRRKYGYVAMAAHVDLHVKHFKKSLLVISDDYVASLASAEDQKRLREKVRSCGIAYRDDSILVDWYVQVFGKTATVRTPELFAETWLSRPTVLELEHYGMVKGHGNWIPRAGSSLEKFGGGRHGADILRNALELLHATYIGYHGYAREWLADNPALTVELLNRCGYWFFPHTVTVPGGWMAGRTNTVQIAWQNRGVAPSYRPYDLVLRLKAADTFDFEQPANNTRWVPDADGIVWRESYAFKLPASLPAGEYEFAFKLRSKEAGRDVKLPLKAERRDGDGFYALGRVRVYREPSGKK